MKLTFVGTSHGIPEADRFCTSMFLQVGENVYIVDAGAPVSPMLLRFGLTHEAVKGVFITHLHGDHFDGLFEFCDQLGWRYLEADPKILFPEEKGVRLFKYYMNTVSTTKRELDLGAYDEGKIFEDEKISVTAIPTDHSNLPSYAFQVTAEGKKILFSGDMNAEFSEYDRLFADKEYDLVVFEGAHANLLGNADIIGSVKTKQMVINHLYSYRNPENELIKLAEAFPFEFIAATDGMSLEI